jgi:hypothetical protein
MPPRRRTVRELLDAAKATRDRRVRIEAELAAAQLELQRREQAATRKKHLVQLAKTIPQVWSRIETRVAARQASAYSEAIQLLWDLCEIDTDIQSIPDFAHRLAKLKEMHARKQTFIEQLTAKGL